MMKNKKGTIILSIILVVQFIIPLSVWGYETYKNKELKEKGQEVKLLVDYVYYDENQIEFQVLEIQEILEYYNDDNYLVFENNGDGFYICKETENIPDSDLYISKNKLYSWYQEEWCFKYISDVTKKEYEYDWYQLYNNANESVNILNGVCEGPETQAYAVFKIYKNRFEVVNVYVDGIPVDRVIEMYNSNEWDNSRYEYTDKEVYSYYDEEFDEYYGEGTIDDEYVTDVETT